MFRRLFLAAIAALSVVGSAPALAQGRPAPERNVQTLDRILPQIRSRHPGTFYDVEGPFPDQFGQPHYRLKWMTPNGRIIWLNTDARTGRVTGVERGPRNMYEGMPPNARMPPPGYPPPRGYYGGPRGGSGRGGYYGGPRGGFAGERGGFGRGPRGNGRHGG